MSTLTLANMQSQVCGIVGRWMTLVGMFGSAASCTGSNPDLNAPLRDAFIAIGYGPIADPAGLVIADADIMRVNPLVIRRFMEWTELFVLEEVERRWFTIDIERYPMLQMKVVGGVFNDPVAKLERKIQNRLAKLRELVMQPYQGMNVELAEGELFKGSTRDHSVPPYMTDSISPWHLPPDGLWYYGQYANAYWGWGFEGDGLYDYGGLW